MRHHFGFINKNNLKFSLKNFFFFKLQHLKYWLSAILVAERNNPEDTSMMVVRDQKSLVIRWHLREATSEMKCIPMGQNKES